MRIPERPTFNPIDDGNRRTGYSQFTQIKRRSQKRTAVAVDEMPGGDVTCLGDATQQNARFSRTRFDYRDLLIVSRDCVSRRQRKEDSFVIGQELREGI